MQRYLRQKGLNMQRYLRQKGLNILLAGKIKADINIRFK
jgi:hypothetical protein